MDEMRQETTEPAGIAQLVQVHDDHSGVTAGLIFFCFISFILYICILFLLLLTACRLYLFINMVFSIETSSLYNFPKTNLVFSACGIIWHVAMRSGASKGQFA